MAKVRRVDLNADEFLTGIVGLSGQEIAAYLVVILLQYSSGKGVAHDDERLFRIINERRTTVARAVARLVAKGKLHPDGAELVSKRARSELERAAERIKTSSENGAKGGRGRTRNKQNQEPAKPEALSAKKASLTTNNQPPTVSTQATPAPGDAGDPDDLPPSKRIFGKGLDWLAKATGKSKRDVRALVGKWLANVGGGEEGAAIVLEAMREAQNQHALEPVAYITKLLIGTKGGKPNAEQRYRDTLNAGLAAIAEVCGLDAVATERPDAADDRGPAIDGDYRVVGGDEAGGAEGVRGGDGGPVEVPGGVRGGDDARADGPDGLPGRPGGPAGGSPGARDPADQAQPRQQLSDAPAGGDPQARGLGTRGAPVADDQGAARAPEGQGTGEARGGAPAQSGPAGGRGSCACEVSGADDLEIPAFLRRHHHGPARPEPAGSLGGGSGTPGGTAPRPVAPEIAFPVKQDTTNGW